MSNIIIILKMRMTKLIKCLIKHNIKDKFRLSKFGKSKLAAKGPNVLFRVVYGILHRPWREV